MNAFIRRIDDLIRPGASHSGAHQPAGDHEARARDLGIDLAIATAGLAVFGACLPAAGDALWRAAVAAKVAGAFLTAFVVCLAPIYALKRFFFVEVPFDRLVSDLARHLGLGGVFAAAAAGIYALVRRGDPAADGVTALVFMALIVAAVLVCKRRTAWLPGLPAVLAVVMFLSVLAQSAWAFRPYMDPAGPTLFGARTEWLTGAERTDVEDAILAFAAKRKAPPARSTR